MLQKAARLLIISAFFILALSVVGTVLADEPCPNNVCDTAIGSFDVTNPMSVMMRIFSIVLSLGAAGATIVIIVAGYKLVTSRGDKEKIQGARETITSAIVGLLFIVFSLVILSIVAGNILKIPGFS
jgi:hypothetical protein